MAKRGSISLIELHVEKGVLALAAVFLIGMVARFLVMEPNTVTVGSQAHGPGELDQAILRQAEDLQRAVRNADAEAPEVPEYARELRREHEGGLFVEPDAGAPPLPKTLDVVARFNPPLPVLEEGQEPEDVRLVTPLKPTPPVVRTGLSVVYRRPVNLLPFDESTLPEGSTGPAEMSWVTIGSFFPREAQQNEMIKAGYAGYRAKVYVAGVDVQRQQMLANGEFGPWEDVPRAAVMPALDPPAPAYDDRSGELVNQPELDQALTILRSAQQTLMQPLFYPVQAGDDWQLPPLPGLKFETPKEEEEEAAAGESPRGAPAPDRSPPPDPRGGGRAAPGGGGRAAPGGGGRAAPGGGGRSAPGGGRAGPTGGQRPPQTDPGDEARLARQKLEDAREALGKKDWDTANRLCEEVLQIQKASRGLRTQAQRIKELVKIKQEQGSPDVPPPPQEPLPLITNPDKEGEPAVWCHDVTVEPGKTYRYRMRVKLWNRYVGRPDNLHDSNRHLADQSLLVGEWSLPSDPVTATSRRHFFVRGPAFGEPAASVDVFTWYKGNWLKEDFDVRVGDVIGGIEEMKTGDIDEEGKLKREPVDFTTGAIVLDLRFDEPVLYRRTAGRSGEFDYRETKSAILVYLDPADGQVKERISDTDRADPLYKKLRDEWDQFKDLF